MAVHPDLIAVEPLPRLEKVLDGADHRDVFPGISGLTPSIGGGTATYQSQVALETTGGFAVSAPQEEVLSGILEMAQYGLYLESSSALALPCLKKAVQQKSIPEGAGAIIIATSHGYKNDPAIFNCGSLQDQITYVSATEPLDA